jgi:hypothetical protein
MTICGGPIRVLEIEQWTFCISQTSTFGPTNSKNFNSIENKIISAESIQII